MTTSVTNADQVVRDSLVFALRFGDAHQTFDDAVDAGVTQNAPPDLQP